jgi:YgiT-type zinc finger domain-containing protein
MMTKGTRETPCNECGSMANVYRGTYQFNESGLKNVILSGIELIQCPSCGAVDPVIPHVNELMRLLALAVISQPYRLHGNEVKFLRKFIGKSGREFCELLHVNKSTLSKWENDDKPVGPGNDRLIRAIVLGLGDGLKEELEKIINRFGDIKENKRHHQEIEIDTDKMSYHYV